MGEVEVLLSLMNTGDDIVVNIHTYTHILTHKYTHTHIHTYIYIHTQWVESKSSSLS